MTKRQQIEQIATGDPSDPKTQAAKRLLARHTEDYTFDDPPGTLLDRGTFRLGAADVLRYYECATCGTMYPAALNQDHPSCNGVRIRVCPWCHPRGSAKARGDHLRN